jgi:arylsulfatase A-like enzyme
VLGFSPQMPRFVTTGGRLHQGKRPITGEGGGPLGSLHDPFRLDYDPEQGVKLPQLHLPDGTTSEGLAARRSLRESLDEVARRFDRWPQMERLDRFRQQAFSLLTSAAARRVFDLEEEPAELRARYGRFRFGQCCLMARRLVEAGVRFVQVNWSSHVEPVEDTGDGGWDMHDRNFQQLQDRHAWMLDQSLSALLDDLGERGLLAETIVVAVGEFGRTPKINEKAGRDHWQQCYSAVVAGGGLRVGQVIGESDAKGEFPANRPITPADLFHTVLAQIGIGTTQLTAAGISPQGEVVEELV